MATVITQTANPAGVSASANVATYTAASIGTAAPNRIVVVLVGSELASTPIASCTIGGNAMTAGTQGNQGAVYARAFYLLYPTGTTADIAVTFTTNSPTSTQNHIAVYTVVGGTYSSTGADQSTDMDSTDPLTTGSISIASGGGFIAVAASATDTNAKSWANATEDIDADGGALRFTTATRTTSLTTTAVTCTGTTNGEDGALSYFIFGANTSPTVALNSPADSATGVSTTPVLDFTGTDAESNDVRYEVQIDTVNTFDSQTPATANVIVEAWGAGGGGQGSNNVMLTQGKGGGGGAFARDNSVTVSNSTGYSVGVGTGGSGGAAGNPPGAGSNGGNSTFDTTTVVAMGGLSGGNGGTGGTTAGSTGDDEYAGGTGSPGSGISSGGAGGGGAGSGGNGGNASGTTGGTGGTPDGGAGANTTGNPTAPGGGGKNPDWTSAGQAGANGRVRIKALLGVIASATGGTHSADGTYDYWTFTSSGTWTPTLVGGPLITAVSGTDSGFANPDTGGDTDPFNSGENIQFTVQAGDALAEDTYYWRVRGKDPTGSNTYGAWATTRSFTVSSGGTSVKDIIGMGFIPFAR